METETKWVISFIFIIICTITDIRKKEIPISVIVLFGGISLFYIGIQGRRGWYDLIYSLIPGIFFLLLGYCTRQSVGYGDGLVLLIIGLCIGYRGCMAVVMTALLISAVCAAILLACCKVKGKSRMPFVPFLAVGLGVFYIAQKGL